MQRKQTVTSLGILLAFPLFRAQLIFKGQIREIAVAFVGGRAPPTYSDWTVEVAVRGSRWELYFGEASPSGLALGYKDANSHDSVRRGPLLDTAKDGSQDSMRAHVVGGASGRLGAGRTGKGGVCACVHPRTNESVCFHFVVETGRRNSKKKKNSKKNTDIKMQI